MKKTYLIILVGVLIVSTSSILIRWIDGVSYAAISFYRLLFSLPFLILYALLRKPSAERKSLKFHWQYALAGLFLAAHFITWIASLQVTTIANSIFLQGTHPLFALLLSVILLKESPKLSIIPAFLFALAGMFFIVFSDINMAGSGVIGDILAIISALMVALYFMIARLFRAKADLILYLIYVYGFAALFCALYMIFTEIPFAGYNWHSWGLIFLLAIGPNLLGHSLFNWASRKIEIYKVNLVLVLEPVLATIGGMFFFAEFPGFGFYIGAALIIMSITNIILTERLKE